jgi:diguanylate cyclase (GGDEF)-like protein
MLASWGYNVVLAQDGVEACQLLRSGDEPSLALLDWTLPALDGIDLCRRLRGGDQCNYVYAILITERRPIEDILEAMDAGADDYIFKPLQSQELRARVRVGARIIKLQERLVQARTELYQQTTRDALTGLWNRAASIEILDSELARGSRTQSPVAAIMADIDHMKRFNAEYGHNTGDIILREAAQRLSGRLRKYDSIGRYGGEEYLIILPNCPHDASIAVAERLRKAIAGEDYLVADKAYSVSCSLGVAWTGDCRVDAETLLLAADEALTAAKRNGRNRVEMGRPPAALAASCPDPVSINC